MAEMKSLFAELGSVRARAQALLDEHPDGLPDEQRAAFDALHTKALELRGQIEAAQEETRKAADIAALADWLDQPRYRMPRGAGNGDEDARKALVQRGWEVKGGIVHAPTSRGTLVPLVPEHVLFGPVQSEADDSAVREDEVRFIRALRASMEPAYRSAYLAWLSTSLRYRDPVVASSMIAQRLSADEKKALSEGTDTAGGVTVPLDFIPELLARRADRAVMRGLAMVQTTSRDRIAWPRVSGHATQGSIFSSGFVGSWDAETPTFTDVDPTFGAFEISIKKIRVATRLSNDLISDSAVNLMAWLTRNGAENLALVEDQGFIVGGTIAGVSPARQPLGITVGTPAANQINTAGTTANTISNTTANVGSAPKLIDLIYALPPQYRANAKLLMAPNTERNIRKLVDAQGRFLWMTGASSQFGGMPGRYDFEGYPVLNSQFMPADGTAGNINIVFGEFSAYIIADRAQITTTILRERFADSDQTGVILWERVGGATWNEDALRFGLAG